ncbi:hypothetical protein SFC43_13500 [Bacteroides sp. CR5/BHMF/2]|nr:hypothetical protein [Bacteroides sp. CR5/BHMF/2]
MQTDVRTLRDRGLEISCANISCGYYYPHTPHEMTNIEDLKKCRKLVEHIIENCREVYTYKEERPQWPDRSFDFFSDAFPSSRSQSRSQSVAQPTQRRKPMLQRHSGKLPKPMRKNVQKQKENDKLLLHESGRQT